MRAWRAVAVAALLAVAAWGAVAMLDTEDDGGSGSGSGERPERLIDARPAELEWIEVIAPQTSRFARLEVDSGALVVAEGASVDADRLAQLRGDLAPLLAIRLLPEADPAFGLAEPELRVAVSAGGEVTHIAVGVPNFDDTGVYVRVGDRIALVLPRVVETLTAAVS